MNCSHNCMMCRVWKYIKKHFKNFVIKTIIFFNMLSLMYWIVYIDYIISWQPYKISSDLCHIDHPLRSVELAARYIDLTEEEEHAIFYHDGAYGSLAYDLKGHEEPLQVIIHFADFWSAQFLEVGKLDRFNDQVKSEETTDEVKEEGENNEE